MLFVGFKFDMGWGLARIYGMFSGHHSGVDYIRVVMDHRTFLRYLFSTTFLYQMSVDMEDIYKTGKIND